MLRRCLSPAVLIATGAVLNGLCYWLMSLPLGLGWTLAVRSVEGAPDMVVLAGVLALIARSGAQEQRGFRFGLAGTVMLLGLAMGIISGGIFGERFPSGVFVVGAIECAVLAIVADDPMAAIDLPHFCAEAGHALLSAEPAPGGGRRFVIRKGD